MPNICAPGVNIVFAYDYAALCKNVADQIDALVRRKPNAVLGLATGATPIGVYTELIRRYREEGLDFSCVTCFNLDEYYPMLPGSPHSYRRFMAENLFDHINCQSWVVPDGRSGTLDHIDAVCADYEDAIQDCGGIDLQILGIGRTGHLGFNEPGSSLHSRTRLVSLDSVTRQDAAPGFGGLASVPEQAITMGVGTILEARQLVMMASGAGKADIVHRALTGVITDQLPASFIRMHANASVYLDAAASPPQKRQAYESLMD